MSLSIGQIIWIVVGLLVALGIALIVRRRLYVKSLRDKGWTFDGSPTLASVYGLNCPPFGLGYDRRIDDQISGTTSAGVPFAVFEYNKLGYVATLGLPRPLPELYVTKAARPGVVGMQKQLGPWLVTAQDPAWAEAAMSSVGGAVDALAAGGHPVDLSVDGVRLVAIGVPRKAHEMEAFLEAVAPVAQALAAGSLNAFRGPNPPAELSLYQHPDWIYRPADDSWLSQVVHTSGGYGHEARDVVLAELHGIRMIGLTHHWKTDRTVTSTDSNGNTSTRTETDHHNEDVLEFHLPWHFGDLSVNWSGWGDRVRFESADFDKAFKVRCAYPKFASDVFHPRQMEFMLRAQPLPFAIESGRVRFSPGVNDPTVFAHCGNFLITFLAGVPGFVWEDLGHAQPPISRDLDGF